MEASAVPKGGRGGGGRGRGRGGGGGGGGFIHNDSGLVQVVLFIGYILLGLSVFSMLISCCYKCVECCNRLDHEFDHEFVKSNNDSVLTTVPPLDANLSYPAQPVEYLNVVPPYATPYPPKPAYIPEQVPIHIYIGEPNFKNIHIMQ